MPQNKKYDKIVLGAFIVRLLMVVYFASTYTPLLYIGIIPVLVIIWCYIKKENGSTVSVSNEEINKKIQEKKEVL